MLYSTHASQENCRLRLPRHLPVLSNLLHFPLAFLLRGCGDSVDRPWRNSAYRDRAPLRYPCLLFRARSPASTVPSSVPDSELLGFVKLFRQRTTLAVRGRDGALIWQRGYHERTLRSNERVEVIARYIESNPVRAGLVRTVDDWPHTGGVCEARLKSGPAAVLRSPEPEAEAHPYSENGRRRSPRRGGPR
jgi:hypothetical protein